MRKRDLTRQKILRSARRLFNRHGFDAVSIDEVMADAGLTRGSFYSYFESKGDLYAEAVVDILNEKQLLGGDGVSVDPRAVDSAAQFIRDYLSLEHFEDIDGSCPLVAFPSEFLRKEPRVTIPIRVCNWISDFSDATAAISDRAAWTARSASSSRACG